MKIPRLLAISSPEVGPGEAWSRWCGELAAAGVDALQVRRKSGSDREVLALATEARARTVSALALLVNARFDLALAAGADGVQLPAAGLPVARVRAALAAGADRPLLLGRSTHSVEEVRRARAEGADFVLFGPVFETPSKVGRIPSRGLAGLAEAASCGLPVLALGGIDGGNAAQALDAGAWGLAAIRWFADPAASRADFALLQRRWQAA